MKYVLISGIYKIDGEVHIGYGIGCVEDDSLAFEDLTNDRSEAERLVELCNESELSPVHLESVVEDFVIGSP